MARKFPFPLKLNFVNAGKISSAEMYTRKRNERHSKEKYPLLTAYKKYLFVGLEKMYSILSVSLFTISTAMDFCSNELVIATLN